MADPNQALWFAFEGEKLLVFDEGPARVPLAGGPEELDFDVTFRWELGELDGHTCWAVETDSEAPEGMVFRDLRSFFFGVDEDFFRMAGLAKQMVAGTRHTASAGAVAGRPSRCPASSRRGVRGAG